MCPTKTKTRLGGNSGMLIGRCVFASAGASAGQLPSTSTSIYGNCPASPHRLTRTSRCQPTASGRPHNMRSSDAISVWNGPTEFWLSKTICVRKSARAYPDLLNLRRIEISCRLSSKDALKQTPRASRSMLLIAQVASRSISRFGRMIRLSWIGDAISMVSASELRLSEEFLSCPITAT